MKEEKLKYLEQFNSSIELFVLYLSPLVFLCQKRIVVSEGLQKSFHGMRFGEGNLLKASPSTFSYVGSGKGRMPKNSSCKNKPYL